MDELGDEMKTSSSNKSLNLCLNLLSSFNYKFSYNDQNSLEVVIEMLKKFLYLGGDEFIN